MPTYRWLFRNIRPIHVFVLPSFITRIFFNEICTTDFTKLLYHNTFSTPRPIEIQPCYCKFLFSAPLSQLFIDDYVYTSTWKHLSLGLYRDRLCLLLLYISVYRYWSLTYLAYVPWPTGEDGCPDGLSFCHRTLVIAWSNVDFSFVSFIWSQSHRECLGYYYVKWVWTFIHFEKLPHPWGR